MPRITCPTLATALLGLLLSTTPALSALQPGIAAPDFSAPASLAGRAFDFHLSTALARGPVVVYFYPAAYTVGCSLQAHAFASQHERFTAAGASVVGVSLDRINKLNAFSADPETCAGKVAVASDPEGRIARAYELVLRSGGAGRRDTKGSAIDHDLAERTSFVIGRDGRIAATISGLAPEDNVAQALSAVQALAAKR